MVYAQFIFGVLGFQDTTENHAIVWRISKSLDRSVRLSTFNPKEYNDKGETIPTPTPTIDLDTVKYWVDCEGTLEVIKEYCYLLAQD